jgi:hypothetical protein
VYEDFSPTSSSASFIIQTTVINEVTADDRVEVNFVTTSVTGHLFASKTISPGVDAVSSNTVLTNESPSVIVVDTAPSTITLPDTNDLLIKGMKYVIINTAADGTVTVAMAVGLDTIGGIGSSLTLSSQYNKIVLMYVTDNLWIEL